MARKIKIIRTIESFYPVMSGPANQAFRVSKELEKIGISSPVFTSNFGVENKPAHEKIEGVEVYRFPIKFCFMKYFYTPAIKKMLTDFDIMHAHSYRGYQTEIAYKTAKKLGKPFIFQNHGSLLGYKSFVKGIMKLPYLFYDLLYKKIALDADAVIVNTKQEFDEAIEFGVDKKKIHIIPVGIDASKYAPAQKDWQETRLLFVGRISKDRNIEPIIHALKILQKKNVLLTVVGGAVKRSDTEKGDYLYELKNLVSELGLNDKVEFVGAKYGDELVDYYNKADIFVYTSLWENFGQTILEAAAAGLPLICTRVGVALDLVNKNTGKLVDFDNPKQIADAVLSFEKKKRDSASKELIEKVKNEFNTERITEKYITLYNSLIAQGGKNI